MSNNRNDTRTSVSDLFKNMVSYLNVSQNPPAYQTSQGELFYAAWARTGKNVRKAIQEYDRQAITGQRRTSRQKSAN